MKYIYDEVKMTYAPYIEKYRLLKYVSILLLCIVMFLLGTMTLSVEKEVKIKFIYMHTPLPFTEENLIAKLKELGISYIDVVIRQAKHETGNFRSELFLNAHNLFGMKVARVRPRLQRGKYVIGKEVYASYNNWEESVIDYALWQSSVCFVTDSKDKYYDYLGRNYATDQAYVEKLKRIDV